MRDWRINADAHVCLTIRLSPLQLGSNVLANIILFYLAHLCQMEVPSLINFRCKGSLGGTFHFYSNFDRTFCKQTVEILIRRRFLRRLVWVCTVCLCPTKRMLGLNRLNVTHKHIYACIYAHTGQKQFVSLPQ